MPFPEVKRVIYKKNPLDRVICQLRFPSILKIDAEIPAEFQERVRSDFPNYSEKTELITAGLRIGPSPRIKEQIPPELSPSFQSPAPKNYEFSSEDGRWEINLTRAFIALTTRKYEGWEDFKEKLEIPLEALISVYSPEYFSRIGLRYVDVIKRSTLGVDDVGWTELLQPHVLGVLTASEMKEHVRSLESTCEMTLSDGESVVRMVTRLVEDEDKSEICYVIDSDFSNTEKTSIDGSIGKLDYFNKCASRLFQWCITERLHESMEPQSA